jgi:hypothetical protein
VAKKQQMIIMDNDGSFQIEVVGESHYRANLRKIAGSCEDDAVEVVKTAYLVPEPRNAHDPNAVRVDVDQLTVGYLTRPVAAQLSPVLRRLELVAVQTQAQISAFEGASNYSVWVDGSIEEILREFSTPARPWWRFW